MNESEIQSIQNAINATDIYVLAACAAFACAAGLSLSITDRSYRNCAHLLSLGAISGLVGLAACSVVAHFSGGVSGNWLLLPFVSILAGFSGKAIEKKLRSKITDYIEILLDAAFHKLTGRSPKKDEDTP